MCWFQARLRRSSMDDFVPFVVGTDLHFSLLYSFRGTAGIHSWCLCLHTVCYIYYNLYTIIQYHPFYSVLSGSALQQQSQDNQQAPSLSLLFSWQVQVSDTFGLEEDVACIHPLRNRQADENRGPEAAVAANATTVWKYSDCKESRR